MGQILTTASYFSNGETGIAGQAKQYRVAVTGTWAEGDKGTLLPQVTLSGLQTLIGAGDVTGLTPVYLLTYKKKMFFIAGTTLYFSVVDTPNSFNEIAGAGNGFVAMANAFSTPENLVALAPYQGRLAVFGRGSTQIWSIAADPAAFNQDQVLNNVGTFARRSVAALGELDVFFLHDSGIRSLRVRDSTLNAVIDDVGSPIDLTVLAKMRSASSTELAAACGIVEPTANRYWLFIKDTIYVLSKFPSAKISAWSTIKPTYQSANVFRVSHNQGADYSFKTTLVNDVTHFIEETAAVASGVQADLTKPAKYIFAVDANGDVADSAEITDGVFFRGQIAWDGAAFTFTSNQTAFVPQHFFVYEGQVFARSSDAIFQYGGTDKATYDNAVALARLPWLDADSSEKDKQAVAIVASMEQTWDFFASMDYLTEEFAQVLSAAASATYDGGKIPFSSVGTHFSFIATCADTDGGKLSALTLLYNVDRG